MGDGKVGSDGRIGGLHGLIIMEEERGVAGWWGLSLQRPDMNVGNSHVIHEAWFWVWVGSGHSTGNKQQM